MPAKTFFFDNAVLAAALTAGTYTGSTVYAALFTTAPTTAYTSGSPTGVEVSTSGTAYARQSATFGAPASGVTSNSTPINYSAATASWGTVVAVGIFDAASGGNLLYFGNLGTPKTVGIGDTVSFAAAALAVTEQ